MGLSVNEPVCADCIRLRSLTTLYVCTPDIFSTYYSAVRFRNAVLEFLSGDN